LTANDSCVEEIIMPVGPARYLRKLR
jgi:hypothetical protein